jgi:multicomponent Na+:H+ antiporter subunit E
MTVLLSWCFRLLLWILLTADLSGLNLAIGVAVTLLLPQAQRRRQPLMPVLRALMASLVAIPLAYGEAFALMSARNGEQERWIERSASGSTSPLVVFLEVLAITLTPFTIVLGVSTDGTAPRYRIHQLRPRHGSGQDPDAAALLAAEPR